MRAESHPVRDRVQSRLDNLRLRGAVGLIVATATTLAVTAAILQRLIDPAFETMGDALWWAVSTVSTVGYGDVIPVSTQGRIVASCLMLLGLALIPTITSVVVSILVGHRTRHEREATEREFAKVIDLLQVLEARLASLERRSDEW